MCVFDKIFILTHLLPMAEGSVALRSNHRLGLTNQKFRFERQAWVGAQFSNWQLSRSKHSLFLLLRWQTQNCTHCRTNKSFSLRLWSTWPQSFCLRSSELPKCFPECKIFPCIRWSSCQRCSNFRDNANGNKKTIYFLNQQLFISKFYKNSTKRCLRLWLDTRK